MSDLPHPQSTPAADGWEGRLMNDRPAARPMEQSLEQLHRLASIGTLSAGMAHEIKNALVPVRTFVEVLLSQYPGMELAGVVDRELRRIDSLVNQMLRYAGPAKPTFGPLHLHEVIEHSLRLLQVPMQNKGAVVRKSLQAAPDSVEGDRYQLEQAFTNLFLNALEAMPMGGELFVSTEFVRAQAGTGLVQVKIRDTGSGIPPAHLTRLFDTFFTTKPNGTGLGLTITRRILKEHQGSIEVESELHKGTTFTLRLPVAVMSA